MCVEGDVFGLIYSIQRVRRKNRHDPHNEVEKIAFDIVSGAVAHNIRVLL